VLIRSFYPQIAKAGQAAQHDERVGGVSVLANDRFFVRNVLIALHFRE